MVLDTVKGLQLQGSVRTWQRRTIKRELVIEKDFHWLEQELHEKQQLLSKTLIFCKLKRNCSRIHSLLTTSSKSLQQHVAIFHSDTPETRKEDILKNFVSESSNIRVPLATLAFGMGVHVHGLHTFVHFGPSRD